MILQNYGRLFYLLRMLLLWAKGLLVDNLLTSRMLTNWKMVQWVTYVRNMTCKLHTCELELKPTFLNVGTRCWTINRNILYKYRHYMTEYMQQTADLAKRLAWCHWVMQQCTLASFRYRKREVVNWACRLSPATAKKLSAVASCRTQASSDRCISTMLATAWLISSDTT